MVETTPVFLPDVIMYVRDVRCVGTVQTSTILLFAPETRCLPSADSTGSVQASSVLSVSPVDESHTRTELSQGSETMRLPSLENAVFTGLPTIIINGMSPRSELTKPGILRKCFLH